MQLSVAHSNGGALRETCLACLACVRVPPPNFGLVSHVMVAPCCCPVSGRRPGRVGAGSVGLQQLDTRSRNAPDPDGGAFLSLLQGRGNCARLARRKRLVPATHNECVGVHRCPTLHCVCLHTVACEAALRSLKKIFYLINKNIPHILVVPSV